MSEGVLGIVAVVAIVAVILIRRWMATARAVSTLVAEVCSAHGAPDLQFHLTPYLEAVTKGHHPDVVPGQWWIAQGLEQVGSPKRARLLKEWTTPSERDVHRAISDMLSVWGGPAILPPHLAEGFFQGGVPGQPKEIVYARVTGRYRPIGGWTVAVPPNLVGQKIDRSQVVAT